MTVLLHDAPSASWSSEVESASRRTIGAELAL